MSEFDPAPLQPSNDRQKNPSVFKGKTSQEAHVGHASTRVRTPHPLPTEFFEEPQYPDVNLDELRVKLPVSYVPFKPPMPGDPFVTMMDHGKKWLTQAKNNGSNLTPEKMVRLIQYATGVTLNDMGLQNMHGLARDMITKPTYEKGASMAWHDESFAPRNDVPKVVYNADGVTTRIVRPGIGAQGLMLARIMAHAESDGVNDGVEAMK